MNYNMFSSTQNWWPMHSPKVIRMPKYIQNKFKRYLDWGTICGSACGANPSGIDDANSPLGKLLLVDCDEGFGGTRWGLWGNSSPALWKYINFEVRKPLLWKY